MTVSCRRISTLVMKIETDFLKTPGLRLTLSQAQHRFGLNAIMCEAMLDALVDATVLTKARDGSYSRFFPRLAGQPVTGFAA